jgi:hypothetical protein
VTGSTGFAGAFGSRQYGVGVEGGRQVMRNLWLALGYNVLGYRSGDLAGDDSTRRGAYVRLRFKFDENLFRGGAK